MYNINTIGIIVNVIGCFGASGTTFYIGAMRNVNGQTDNLWLFITTPSSSPVSYTVEQRTGVIATGTVTNTSPVNVSLPHSLVTLDSSYSNRENGIVVYSDPNPISVVLVHYKSTTSGEYLAYPYQEYPVSQYQYYLVSVGTPTFFRSEALLIGNVDNTAVTITPTQNITVPQDIQNPSSSSITVNAGTSFNVTIHRMQTFFFGTYMDISGTSIVSDKPLTVISGHECGYAPDNVIDCDHLTEQIPPTVTWGKQFLLTPYAGRSRQFYKIIAAESDTALNYTCSDVGTSTISLTNAGDFSFQFSNNGIYCSLVSNKPVLVVQLGPGYNLSPDGDPVISMVPPIDQYSESVTFISPDISDFTSHHVNIASVTIDTILMDGQPLSLTWNTISDSDNNIVGYGTQVLITDLTSHTITSMSNTKFSTLVYGFGTDIGYSYSAGVNFCGNGKLSLNNCVSQ